jgi:hypothetical protein
MDRWPGSRSPLPPEKRLVDLHPVPDCPEGGLSARFDDLLA